MTVFNNPAELRRRGLEVLVRELGYVNAMRFMLLSETGSGDYTRERDHMLPDWSVEQAVKEADGRVPHC
jgi:hypothetical protein